MNETNGNEPAVEPHIYASASMSNPDNLQVGLGRAAIISTPKPIPDSVNEDTAAIIPISPTQAVLLVADGAGGHRCGDLASQTAITTMARRLAAVEDPSNLRSAILDGFEAANQEVLNLGNGALTTLVVAEIREQIVRPYHVGDSFLMVIGQRGKLKMQTLAHSPTAYAVESGLMSEAEAIDHEERHIVTNMLGSPSMRIEIGSELKLAPHDCVLLACDGLSDNLLTNEIIDLARKGPLPKMLKTLYALCHQRMCNSNKDTPSKPDDLTIIAFRLQ